MTNMADVRVGDILLMDGECWREDVRMEKAVVTAITHYVSSNAVDITLLWMTGPKSGEYSRVLDNDLDKYIQRV